MPVLPPIASDYTETVKSAAQANAAVAAVNSGKSIKWSPSIGSTRLNTALTTIVRASAVSRTTGPKARSLVLSAPPPPPIVIPPFVNPTLTIGPATTVVAQSPFAEGGSSYNFVRSANSYIRVPGSADWAAGTGDFTIEWFSYQTTFFTTQRVFTIGSSPRLGASISAGTFQYFANSGSARFSSANAMTVDTWFHWAIVRQSGTTRVYRNGIQLGSAIVDVNNITDAVQPITLGNDNVFSVNAAFIGYITNFRWVKGLAVYTGNFTVPTSELTVIASANPYGGANTAAIGAGFTKLLIVPNGGGAVPLFTYDTYVLDVDSGRGFLAKYTDAGRIVWVTRIINGTPSIVSVDDSENIYAVGTCSSSPLQFFNSNESSFGTLAVVGSSPIFIAKYNSNGIVQWATGITGSISISGVSSTVDSAGNVYLNITYSSNPVTIYNTNGSVFKTLTSQSGSDRDSCVIKYNSSGVAQWAAITVSDLGNEDAGGISVDSNGNVFVGVSCRQQVSIYNGDDSLFYQFDTTNNENFNNVFVIKYNSSGVAQWQTHVSAGIQNIFMEDCKVDSAGNLLVSFQRGDTRASDGTPPIIYNTDNTVFQLSQIESEPFLTNGFVVKYNTSGMAQWALLVQTRSRVLLVTGLSGNIYLQARSSSQDGIIYNADDTQFAAISGGGTSIVRYNSEGVAQWTTRMLIDLTAITRDSSDTNLYTTGIYSVTPVEIYNSDTTQFGTLPVAQINNDADFGAGVNGFIIKYNTSGFAQWALRMSTVGLFMGVGLGGMAHKGTSLYVGGTYDSLYGDTTLRSVGF